MSPTSGPLVLGDDFVQDAHTVAAAVRDATPVRHVVLPSGMPVWLVTGYEAARAVAADPRFSSDHVYDRMHRMALGEDEESPFSPDFASNLLNLDPPDHTRLRRLIAATFTGRSVAPLRPRIQQIADELLDEMTGHDTVDLLSAYAYPLPIRVITELLGVPFEDREQFTEWSETMVDGGATEAAGAATMSMAGYLHGLIEAKRDVPDGATPPGDLLSRLVHASEDGDRLTTPELIATAVVLLVGGFETTVNLISGGVLSLAGHPDQLALLRADRSLMPTAIEEFLRYETPNILSSPRYATERVEIAGVEIPKDDFVMVSWLAANRDPARFADPDRLDITRPRGGHLAFGHGVHFCLGAPLARLEGEIAFGGLLDRFAEIEVVSAADDLRWRDSTAMHGLESLVVRLR
ncbi:cytochrome P450 family protein [Pseudonocardia sp. HH130630-07]|uniref:cytochrome P450 family protein n=1 Tax=Pseudonocardia sp. HH130630-07 TaxID=1690815 RepID=UPI0008151C65|nr:cytochrome P450 [Pseudonocardia sp. HH130630-07]ANY08125.1 cytochrome [Pseudonocardia sp. HH130630-07]